MNKPANDSVRAPVNEQGLIERYFLRPAAEARAGIGDKVEVGIGDDAAVLACGACTDGGRDERLVVTADTLVAGRHFTPDADPADVGHKALAVALSDLAAMGAAPRWATLCLSVPEESFDRDEERDELRNKSRSKSRNKPRNELRNESRIEEWLVGFSRGFFALANRWGVALVGGDLVRGPCTISVQLGGEVAASRVLLRSGARVGDGVYLSGAVGEAGLAWREPGLMDVASMDVSAIEATVKEMGRPQLRSDGKNLLADVKSAAEACIERLRRPQPRLGEGEVIAGFASAAIDVSDGLLCDLDRLARASDVAVRLEIQRIPLGAACRRYCNQPEDWVAPLTGGDDYELLFTMDDKRASALAKALKRGGLTPCTRIGEVVAHGAGERLRCTFNGAAWRLPTRLGFDHFAGAGERAV